jgi:hypothetical protein
MNNWCICCFSSIFLLGILIFKGLTAQRLYMSFSFKGFRATFRNFVKAPKIAMRIPMFGKAIQRRCVCSGIPVGYS